MHAYQLVGGMLILILLKKLFDYRNAATANGKCDAASSSSTTQGDDSSSSSFPSSGWDYEVFLSFRGEDIRKTFTDHLYNALVNRGIHTFRDNEGLRIGENIDPALRSAIHQSKIVIPIFSKDYASSKWCLRELAEIVECMKKQGQRQITVMPVFYHVDPSEVRHQIGCYKKAFQNHHRKFGQETEGWKKALKQVADLKGWDLKNIANGHEGKLIQLIVKEVWSELKKNPLIVPDNLVGIHSHVEKMKKLLNVGSDGTQIAGIHGLGGIDKTIIARNAAIANGKSDATSSSSATQGDDSSSSSFSSFGRDYEVFLSFRGEDTRTNFPQHLYGTLAKTGIHTFMDNEEDLIGGKIYPALRSAIHHSKIAIPIFSKHYASSKWCLRQLTEIVKCMKQEGQRQIIVMPVFYYVDPKDVRNQTGSYEKVFQDHHKKFGQETEEWKNALNQVGHLSGWYLENIANGNEYELIKLIVKEVWSVLKKSSSTVFDNLVGIHSHVEEMEKFLNIESSYIRIVGIFGLGGIGKTTIARCVYNTIYHHFEGCSFLADVRETFQIRGPIHLQCQLLINILNMENLNITSVDEGIDMIKRRLSNKKVLIVVDDVDENTDISGIIGKHDWFGIGSKIIITTRDRGILEVLGVDSIYGPNEMDSDQSLLLFSKHAFKRDQPPEQYLDLSKEMIKTAGGLPLALVVLGSFLVGKRESAWKDTVKKLKEIPNHKVLEKLRISYDGLDRVEKKMFLDIACFFIGMNKDIACYIWDGCGFFPEITIDVLCQKSLVKIGESNELRMHDQLRDLGREIVFQENPTNPGKRSRLWLKPEILDVLSTQMGTSEVEGLCIDFGFRGGGQCLVGEGFASMTKLRLLQLNYAEVAGNFVHSFSELRWLSWKGCPIEFTPTNLRKLVVLDLSYSDFTENWMGWKYIKEAETLKVVNLSYCDKLSRTPNFSANLLLERLIFKECRNVVMIDESIGHLKRLVSLIIEGCHSLRKIPNLLNSKKLEFIVITWCNELSEIEGLEGLDSLKKFIVIYCDSLRKIPNLSCLQNLVRIEITGCNKLSEIEGVEGLASLEQLIIQKCHSLRKIPNFSNSKDLEFIEIKRCHELSEIEGLEGLDSLEQLIIQECHSLRKLPNFSHSKNLKFIEIKRCHELSEIEGLQGLDSLERLIIQECHSLRKIPKFSDSKNLKFIQIKRCDKLSEIEGFNGLYSLEELIIEGCVLLRKIPNLSDLKNIKWINISSCNELSEIEGLEGLDSPKKLQLRILRCHSLTKIHLPKKLLTLVIRTCKKFSEIEGVEDLEALTECMLFHLESITRLPDLSNLKTLKYLKIWGLKMLPEIGCLEGLKSLEGLEIGDAPSLKVLPDVSTLKNLKHLTLSDCGYVERLPDLSNLNKLNKLVVKDCKKLTEIPGVDKLESLEKLEVRWCESMERLPDLSNLTKLRALCIQYCEKLSEIQGVDMLEILETLCIDGCISIETLPCLSNLKNLETLSAVNCKKLTEIQGVDKLRSLEVLDVRNSNESSSSSMSYSEVDMRDVNSSLALDLELEISDDDSTLIPDLGLEITDGESSLVPDLEVETTDDDSPLAAEP